MNSDPRLISRVWSRSKRSPMLKGKTDSTLDLGVPKIIVGFRSPSGVLLRLEEFQTQDIPSLVKRMSGAWDGNLCINFTAAFLDCTSFLLTKSMEDWLKDNSRAEKDSDDRWTVAYQTRREVVCDRSLPNRRLESWEHPVWRILEVENQHLRRCMIL